MLNLRLYFVTKQKDTYKKLQFYPNYISWSKLVSSYLYHLNIMMFCNKLFYREFSLKSF